MKKIMLVSLLSAATLGGLIFTGSITGCVSVQQNLDDMSQLDFNRLKILSSVTVKVLANRMLESGQVSTEDINQAINVLSAVSSTPIIGSANDFVQSLLGQFGVSSLEVQSLVELVVFELDARGILRNLMPDGTIAFSPRALELRDALILALQSAVDGVAPEEMNAFNSSRVQ